MKIVLETNRIVIVIIGISLLFITSELMGVTNLIDDNGINKQSSGLQCRGLYCEYIVERDITEINDNNCDYSVHGDGEDGATYFCNDTKFGDCILKDNYLSDDRKYLICER